MRNLIDDLLSLEKSKADKLIENYLLERERIEIEIEKRKLLEKEKFLKQIYKYVMSFSNDKIKLDIFPYGKVTKNDFYKNYNYITSYINKDNIDVDDSIFDSSSEGYSTSSDDKHLIKKLKNELLIQCEIVYINQLNNADETIKNIKKHFKQELREKKFKKLLWNSKDGLIKN